MFDALLGFGGSLIKGFLDRDATKDANAANAAAARELNQNKIQWTVEDAKKAGIHPLAAIGSPVAGSWAQSTAEPASLGDAVGGGIAAVGRSVANRHASELAELQKESIRADIELTRARSRTLIADAVRANRGMELVEKNTTTDPRSRVLGADKSWPDAQVYENRYGELSDFIFGPAIAASDFYHGVMKPASDRFEKRRERWHSGK